MLTTRTFKVALCTLSAVLFLHVSTLQARQTEDSKANPQTESVLDRIKAVSLKSKSVDTARGYATIIDECDSILKEEIKNDSHRDYVKTLLAWSLDHRAMTRIELSKRFEKIQNSEQADRVTLQAFEDFTRAIENNPKRWQIYSNRGTVLAEQDRYTEAVDDFTKVLEIKPDSTLAQFNRAELHYQLGNFEDSLADYNTILTSNADDLQSVSGRAHCLLALNKPQDALAEYERVVQALPDSSWAIANRADAHLAMEAWANARTDLELSLKMKPESVVARKLGWLLATCPVENVCDGEAALVAAQQAITLGGESIANLDTLAAAHAAAGQFQQARDVQTRVIAMQEEDNSEYQVRQATYEKNERYQEKFKQ